MLLCRRRFWRLQPWSCQVLFESPVVRAAFGDFKLQCDSPGFPSLQNHELARSLMTLAARFHRLKVGSGSSHATWNTDKSGCGEDHQKLQRMVLEYLVRVELWRQQGLADERPWNLGTPSSNYQLLASTLAQFWYMEREGCSRFRGVRTDSRDWDILWSH